MSKNLDETARLRSERRLDTIGERRETTLAVDGQEQRTLCRLVIGGSRSYCSLTEKEERIVSARCRIESKIERGMEERKV